MDAISMKRMRGLRHVARFAVVRLLRTLFVVLFGLAPMSQLSQAQTPPLLYWTLWPYDGNVLPLDFKRVIYGQTMGELCAQRSAAEMFAPFGGVPPANVIFVGTLPSGVSCGFQQRNTTVTPEVVVTTTEIPNNTISCSDAINIARNNPGAPTPQSCVMPCAPGAANCMSGKGSGDPCEGCGKATGDPVNPGTGNNFQAERDLVAAVPGGLSLTRYYNTVRSASLTRAFGGNWQHNYSRRIVSLGSDQVYHYSAGGQVLTFQLVNGAWTADADVADQLIELMDRGGRRTGWAYTIAKSDDVETFDASGNLLSVSNRAGLGTRLIYSDGTNGISTGSGGFILDATGNSTGVILPMGQLLKVQDAFGRPLLFGYDSLYRIVKITDPAGSSILYAYDIQSNLTSVTYPDGKQRQYLYNESTQTAGANLPNQLTGISDENGARFVTFAYDQYGRAIKTTNQVSGVEVGRYELSYDVAQAQTTVVDALGTARQGSFQNAIGIVRQTGDRQPAASGAGTASTAISYDSNANVASRIDWNGNRTNYTYDLARNLEISRTEGLTASGDRTPQTRTITTQWHPTFRLPVKVAEPLRITTYSYDANVIHWTNGTVTDCHDSSCTTIFADVAYVPGSNPSLACLTASALTYWFPGTSFGGASGSGIGGDCYYYSGSTQARLGGWALATGCVSGFFPNQVFTPAGSGTCESPAAFNDTVCGATGGLCTKSIQATSDADGSQGFGAAPVGAPRIWTYKYNSNGSVLTVDGPRTDVSDVTTYSYYDNNDGDLGKRGNVATITNALGQITSITAYNAHGQPLTIIDPNGLTTTLTYDSRLRLTSRTVGSETTAYAYDGVGHLTKVTLPDSSFLSYTYDDAHRLTGIQDNLGNHIAYTLDAMGNRTLEQVFDPANALAQTRSRVYSNLNRLFQELGAQSQTTQYAYDDQGNVTSVTDPLNHVTGSQYDALNRLKQVADPNSGVTQYAYNGRDALTQVTDPRSLVTGYTVDGLGNLNSQASPDTGSIINTYDAAGNLLTQTDAKAQVTTYVYDALNRVSLITFNDNSKQQYIYDTATNGLGRLSSITETNPANQQTSLIQYAYDQHGRVTSETRTINGVAYVLAYSYDSAGRLSGLTYPSDRTVTYGFDALGRVNQVSTTRNGQTQVLVQNVQYQPFGGVNSYTLGNGQVYSRTVDQDGRIASYTLGNANYAISFDAASRITGIGANTYAYDILDRLTSAVLPSSNFGYSYDGVGNRLTKTNGAASDMYTYSPSNNRIATLAPAIGPQRSFIFDANGSITDDGINQYAYDSRGRMVQATSSIGSTAYQVNALGQRIRKTNSQDDRVFHYDTRGRLIAETDPGATLKRELFYLGDIPVAVFQ